MENENNPWLNITNQDSLKIQVYYTKDGWVYIDGKFYPTKQAYLNIGLQIDKLMKTNRYFIII